ncbi:hypothetical protein PVAP13_8KG032151 [Panicum virgatum]|uniref:Uncharacterized protein n=1 Tax=Panicum virgatum TaxID=38727 RepID=A0A8T0PFX8_PANVG|nr:hypothetical protein PVAP13_8KG032151 [Panicum virgatum]
MGSPPPDPSAARGSGNAGAYKGRAPVPCCSSADPSAAPAPLYPELATPLLGSLRARKRATTASISTLSLLRRRQELATELRVVVRKQWPRADRCVAEARCRTLSPM